MGYGDILSNYDKITSLDDVVNFISYTDLFDSQYYVGQDLNHSDRKRLRAGRPSADYIRNSLISLNKKRTQFDDDFYLKKLYPEYFNRLKSEIEKINVEAVKIIPKFNGNWILSQFPNLKPGKIIGDILSFLNKKYGDSLESQSEEDIKKEISINFKI